jgi:NAD(P)-dependent dehydrogenase (short-subunit alcohol dehydrogenase family)
LLPKSARSGVGVNAIAPSIAETVLTGPFKQRPDIYNLYAGHTVFNRWSTADEVATAVDGPPTGLTQLHKS